MSSRAIGRRARRRSCHRAGRAGEQHRALHFGAHRVRGVLRLHLPQHARRGDAGAWPIRSAAGISIGARSVAGPAAGSDPGSAVVAGTAAAAGSTRCRWHSGRLDRAGERALHIGEAPRGDDHALDRLRVADRPRRLERALLRDRHRHRVVPRPFRAARWPGVVVAAAAPAAAVPGHVDPPQRRPPVVRRRGRGAVLRMAAQQEDHCGREDSVRQSRNDRRRRDACALEEERDLARMLAVDVNRQVAIRIAGGDRSRHTS